MISTEPRTQDVDVAVITQGGVGTKYASLRPEIWLDAKKKVQFDVDVERDTFF